MAYSSLSDIQAKIDEDTLVQLTDTTGSGVVDTTRVDRAIRISDGLINSYVAKVYAIPLSPVPAVITDISATLAIVEMHRARSVDIRAWKDAAVDAMNFLKAVVAGLVTLEGAKPAGIRSTLMYVATDRRFSRNLLKGM